MIEVGFGVRLHLVLGQLGTRLGSSAGISDQRAEVADDEHDLVAEILELAKLAQADRVAEVNVGRGGIEALLHAKRLLRGERSLELSNELGFGDQLLDAGLDHRELAFDFGGVGRGRHGSRSVARLGLDRPWVCT